MKLALGTVQFGIHYGLANISGQITSIEAKQILQLAQDSGMNTLDTAIDYGNCEAIIGDFGLESWKVVTKLPFVPLDSKDLNGWVQDQVMESLKRLKQDCLYGVLLHRPQQLLSTRGSDLYAALLSLKTEGLAHKIGISIYDPSELQCLLDAYEFDLIQAPLNILDRRLVDSGWANRLKKAGVEVHTRSVFLQGLLLMPSKARPAKFNAWAPVWQVWDQWLAQMGLNPLEGCLSYANSIAHVDRIVIGVDSLAHLSEIIGANKRNLPRLPIFPPLQDERLINPATWSQL